MSDRVSHLAILAPVPWSHLYSGLVNCREAGKVAFGSVLESDFSAIEKLKQGAPVRVLFYASEHPQSLGNVVTWTGLYVGYVLARRGDHPDGMKYRPVTTVTDKKNHWKVFWEVADLTELPLDQWLSISTLTPYPDGNQYASDYIPRRPHLIRHPDIVF